MTHVVRLEECHAICNMCHSASSVPYDVMFAPLCTLHRKRSFTHVRIALYVNNLSCILCSESRYLRAVYTYFVQLHAETPHMDSAIQSPIQQQIKGFCQCPGYSSLNSTSDQYSYMYTAFTIHIFGHYTHICNT
jgi:hypothetical protein